MVFIVNSLLLLTDGHGAPDSVYPIYARHVPTIRPSRSLFTDTLNAPPPAHVRALPVAITRVQGSPCAVNQPEGALFSATTARSSLLHI